VDRAVGDQEQVVFARRVHLHEALHSDGRGVGETVVQRGAECRRVDVGLEAQVAARIRPGFQDVVGLILREHFTEVPADVLRPRVALHRQVAAGEGVEKVEADGKFAAKGRRALAEDGVRVVVHQKVERDLQQPAVAGEEQPILRHDQLERPGVVGHILGKLWHVLAKPLAAPRPRLEPGAHAEEAGLASSASPRRSASPRAKVMASGRCPSTIQSMRAWSSCLWRLAATQSTK
jgi:hypothetical protein